MIALTHADLGLLAAQHAAPAVSLLLPVPHIAPEPAKSRIRLGHLLRQAADQLAIQGLPAAARQSLLAPIWKLLEDQSFWEQPCHGLAVFAAAGFFNVYRAPAPLPELVLVADRFYITPLLPFLRPAEEFYLLALGAGAVRLLRCGQRAAAPVALAPLPGAGAATAQQVAQISRLVRHALRGRRAPLVLAGAAPLLALYRQTNSHPRLHAAELVADADARSSDQLQSAAWQLVAPCFESSGEALDRYRQLCDTQPARVSSQLRAVLAAARSGGVATLLVARGGQQWGALDLFGELRLHSARRPGDTELINAAALDALAGAGAVHAVAPDQLPGGAPLAAILRAELPVRYAA